MRFFLLNVITYVLFLLLTNHNMRSELILDIWDIKQSLCCGGCEMNDCLLITKRFRNCQKVQSDSLVKTLNTFKSAGT